MRPSSHQPTRRPEIGRISIPLTRKEYNYPADHGKTMNHKHFVSAALCYGG